jgi:outer membrane lipopolysaccharide assembly protein LptE/RlpB
MRKGIPAFFALIAMTCLAGCGYRLAGRQLDAGRGLTIAVPTFINRTTAYRIEQRMTEAVRRELLRRTRFSVRPLETGDVVMNGEVMSITLSPIIFNQQGRGTSYNVIVDMKVSVVDTRTSTVVFQNDRWTFREVFELAQNSAEYVPEDTAAMERLSRRFATSVVASILHTKP